MPRHLNVLYKLLAFKTLNYKNVNWCEKLYNVSTGKNTEIEKTWLDSLESTIDLKSYHHTEDHLIRLL